jgi:cysteinyl-tRNA synthetase
LYRSLKDANPSGAPDAQAVARFRAAMDDDFNTPEAMAVIQGVAKELNQAKAASQAGLASSAASTLKYLGDILGILQKGPEAYLKRGAVEGSLTDSQIEELLAARQAARAGKNFGESDRIRAQLTAAGILLEDKAGGKTEWRRA